MRTGDQRPLIRSAVLGALVLLGVLLALGVARFRQLQHHLAATQLALARVDRSLTVQPEAAARLLLDTKALRALELDLASILDELVAVQNLARPFLPFCPYLGWVPGKGGDIQAFPSLLGIAHHTARAALLSVQALGPLASQAEEADQPLGQLGPSLLQALEVALPQLDEAEAEFILAAQDRALIDADRLSNETHGMLARFDQFGPILTTGFRAARVVPALLGSSRPSTYLLLAQNNDELRATGGFISGVGQITLDRGTIVSITFEDSYAVDNLEKPHPLPPAPLRYHMKAGMLVLRDSNWWPNFPTSAAIAAELYRLDREQAVDGVISVDLRALHLLVGALGPITVPGYPEPVTPENLQAQLRAYWQAPRLMPPGEQTSHWWAHRKDFAADLTSALLDSALTTGSVQWPALAHALVEALSHRHLLIYVRDTAAAELLRDLRWDGSIRPAVGDYWMVVDSNVGFNKVNPSIAQAADYEVTLEASGAILARLSLTYHHLVERPTPACVHEPRYGDTYAELTERCYWDYLRIYLPLGSELIELSGSDAPAEIYEESGRTVIATAFLLETGGSREIDLLYRPNLPVTSGEYSLLVQKQPGAQDMPVRVRVLPPTNALPTGAKPSPLAWTDGMAIWQGILQQDWELWLQWK